MEITGTALWLAILTIFIALKCLLSFGKAPGGPPTLDGPFNLPFLGYLPFITEMPHLKLNLLSQKYGPVFRINLGNIETIVLNDFRSIWEAFRKEEFLGRPKDIAFNVLINLEGLGTLSGAAWKEQKRFTMHQMRNLGFGKYSIEQQIKANIANIGQVIDRAISQDEGVYVRELFAVKHFGICNLLFGSGNDRSDQSYRTLQDAIGNAIRSLGQVSLLTFFPSIAKLVAHFKLVPYVNRLKGYFVVVNSYVQREIERHDQTLDENNVRDYIDSFLLQSRLETTKETTTFTKSMLAGNVQGMLAAGIETTRTTLEWALLILAAHPEVQNKVYTELGRVCGSASPSWSNRADLVYTQAVICEVQRWKTISPLNLMRMTTDQCTLHGMTIPKGVHVIANLWAVHFDPNYWRHPSRFDPDRFISMEGQLIKHQRFIPFSLGKRSCPGESMAQMEIFLFITCLLHKYEVLLAEPNSFEEVLGLTLQAKQEVHLRFVARPTDSKLLPSNKHSSQDSGQS